MANLRIDSVDKTISYCNLSTTQHHGSYFFLFFFSFLYSLADFEVLSNKKTARIHYKMYFESWDVLSENDPVNLSQVWL